MGLKSNVLKLKVSVYNLCNLCPEQSKKRKNLKANRTYYKQDVYLHVNCKSRPLVISKLFSVFFQKACKNTQENESKEKKSC